MSGTNHSIPVDPALQPRIVLVRPQMGENIGAAARAMWNFGLEYMHLVAPRDGWPNPSAVAMASGAARVLDQLNVHDSLDAATADCHYVMATTARSRGLTKEVLSPKEAMTRANTVISKKKKVALLFGAERSGLENSELVNCDALISIPVNPAFGSLNLAQAVLLLAYEWRLTGETPPPASMEWAAAQPATQTERQHLVEGLEARLDDLGFFWPETKAEAMRESLRNMFARMPLSDIDVRTFHGIFRALIRDEKFKNKRD